MLQQEHLQLDKQIKEARKERMSNLCKGASRARGQEISRLRDAVEKMKGILGKN